MGEGFSPRDVVHGLDFDDLKWTYPSPSGEGPGVGRFRKRGVRGKAPPQPLP